MQCMQAIVLKKQIYWMANVNYSQIARFYATNFLFYLKPLAWMLSNMRSES